MNTCWRRWFLEQSLSEDLSVVFFWCVGIHDIPFFDGTANCALSLFLPRCTLFAFLLQITHLGLWRTFYWLQCWYLTHDIALLNPMKLWWCFSTTFSPEGVYMLEDLHKMIYLILTRNWRNYFGEDFDFNVILQKAIVGVSRC